MVASIGTCMYLNNHLNALWLGPNGIPIATITIIPMKTTKLYCQYSARRRIRSQCVWTRVATPNTSAKGPMISDQLITSL